MASARTFLLAFAMLAAATHTQAAIVLDTTAGETAALTLPSTSSSLATGNKGWTFTVAGGPWTITDVTWGLYGNAAGAADVGVRLYSGSNPFGTVLEDTGTTNLSLNQIATAQYYDWAGLSWSLAAGTYTIVAYGSTDAVTPRISTTSETMITAAGWGVTSSTQPANNYALLLQATSGSTPVPEPGTCAAAALLVGGAAFAPWRRRRNTVS
jgi:hypothetical protein